MAASLAGPGVAVAVAVAVAVGEALMLSLLGEVMRKHNEPPIGIPIPRMSMNSITLERIQSVLILSYASS